MNLLLFKLFAAASVDCSKANGGLSAGSSGECDTNLPSPAASGAQFQHLLQVALGVFAVIAVLMIIISALNIVYAEGDSNKVAKARSSIIYALVGLVIAISAEIIVTFVVGRFQG